MSVVKVEKQGRVTILTMNRPERRNALTVELAHEMEAAVDEFEYDDEQRVLIITGAGDEAFCSGGDLIEMRHRNLGEQAMPLPVEQDIAGISYCRKPVIAAINGMALGGGLEVAICCDVRLAAEHAWFALPEGERGFIAGLASVTLPRLMPIGAVLDMMLLGERMSAQDAHRLGLVQKVVPGPDLMAEAMRRAEQMSRHSPAALWGTKKVIRYWRDTLMAEHHEYYMQIAQIVFNSGDLYEGLRAFAEKRPAQFASAWPGQPKRRMSQTLYRAKTYESSTT